MKKFIIWILGLLLSFASGILMFRGILIYTYGIKNNTGNNIFLVLMLSYILCDCRIIIFIVLHLIILFQAIKYLKGAKLHIHDLLIATDNTFDMKALKIFGYIFITIFLFEIIWTSCFYNGLDSIYDITSTFMAMIIVSLLIIWFSAIIKSKKGKEHIRSIPAVISICAYAFIIIGVPILLFNPIFKLLSLFEYNPLK